KEYTASLLKRFRRNPMGPTLLTIYILMWPAIVAIVLYVIAHGFLKEWKEARKKGDTLVERLGMILRRGVNVCIRSILLVRYSVLCRLSVGIFLTRCSESDSGQTDYIDKNEVRNSV